MHQGIIVVLKPPRSSFVPVERSRTFIPVMGHAFLIFPSLPGGSGLGPLVAVCLAALDRNNLRYSKIARLTVGRLIGQRRRLEM